VGKILILFGILLVVTGALVTLAPQIPWLGKLPGDIVVKREGFEFRFPLATCLVLSVLLSALLSLFRR
jgi:hypothetical protein